MVAATLRWVVLFMPQSPNVRKSSRDVSSSPASGAVAAATGPATGATGVAATAAPVSAFGLATGVRVQDGDDDNVSSTTAHVASNTRKVRSIRNGRVIFGNVTPTLTIDATVLASADVYRTEACPNAYEITIEI